MVYKSTDHGKFFVDLFFTITLTVFDDHSSRPISDREVDRSVIVKFQMVLLITLFGCL